MKFPKKISDDIHGILDSPLHRAMRDAYDSPAFRLARDLTDSPAMRLAREMQESPTMRIMRDIHALSDEFSVAGRLAAGMSGGLAAAQSLHAYTRISEAGAIAGRLADGFSDIAKRYSLLEDGVLSSLNGQLAALTRSNQWASQLNESSATRLGALIGTQPTLMGEVRRIRQAAMGIAGTSSQFDSLRLSQALGLSRAFSSEFEQTRFKLSALAGAGDVLGFGAKTSFAAYDQLFGTWHTNPNLPDRFWRDPAMRRQRYSEAEVDEGLIEATPAVALDVIIGSGLAAGVSEDGVSVAVVHISGVSMEIRSNNVSRGSFDVICAFEQLLRLFISMKLEAVAGPKWMKQRVDGTAHSKARENRATALENGEKEKSLISYLDLGDLASILLRKDNWDGVFGSIFPNRERLQFDLQALIATRRPTMHARKIDAVRLVELMCIVSRLKQWIDGDGEWKRSADEDD